MTALLPPDEKNLLDIKSILIHYVGEDCRISKEELCHRLHTSDRKVRISISELQSRGELICTDTDEGSYYYLGANTEPMLRYINQERHRGNAILAKARALEVALKATRGIDAQQGRLI